jgi:predicted acetyltransferase
MADFTVRAFAEGEQRAAYTLLAQSLHGTAASDETWERVRRSFPAERKFGAFDGAEPIGMVSSFATELAVPGGAVVSAAAVDGVGVRADWTRRGVLTALMGEQLPDLAARGHVLATLHASESVIYGRFGFGPATSGKTVRVLRHRARWRPELPESGRVSLLGPEDAVKRVPEVYERIGPVRPGMIHRPEVWWPGSHDRLAGPGGVHRAAVHTGPEGDDGFVVYRTERQGSFEDPGKGATLEVRDMHAAGPAALAGLWRFLLGVDLVAEVRAPMRPVDEPLDAMLLDSRACQVVGLRDHTWVRLLDVSTALAARSYRPGDPVVLEVVDPVLPENAGRYLVTSDGVVRTGAEPGLRLDADTLAMLYLGQWRPSTLAATGRIQVLDEASVERADELFRGAVVPWCGTYF